MKNRHMFLSLVLLPLLLSVGPRAYAQAVRNPERDLSILFSSNYRPSSPPPPAAVCSIGGRIDNDMSAYRTKVGLYRDNGSRTPFSFDKSHRREDMPPIVPVGNYLVIPKGNYPSGGGREGGLWPFPRSQRVSCRPNGSHRADFRIESDEG